MQGTLRTSKRVAKLKLRVRADALPSDAEVLCSDIMLQPGGTVSGWVPNASELQWSDGISEDGL